ncbi:MAG: hypothetical protein Q9183_004450 [Haloplaca sp. 2 TL-2023]
MRPDFESCGRDFLNHSKDIYSDYVYHGPLRGFLKELKPSLITVQGCRELCGTGTEYYPWKDSSNTITTWVLPIIGLLVQAPFESNQAWQTILLLARWIGNPIATFSYILWNVKVTGKCALMVDMATRYDEYPSADSDFSLMRDSFFILAIMNQYTVNPTMPPVEAERLLRLALFSNLIRLPDSGDDKAGLVKRRTLLANNLRENRKKGVVPVFVSFLWFVFSLGLSIDLAFTDIGSNQIAHNLAIGFLMGWLPILVLASTVDRNLVSAEAIREKFNDLINDVRTALLDPEVLAIYMKDTETTPEDFSWMHCLGNNSLFPKNFFIGFGGQGRTLWHYGVAHPLLAGIESKFMAEYGRDWLRPGYAARLAIVVGSRNVNGLKMFDPRMVWQISASLLVIGGSVGGAFILSWFTPTVGLGCRSGGYLVYFIGANALIFIELVIWWLTHESTHTPDDLVVRLGSKLEQQISSHGTSNERLSIWRWAQGILPWLRSLTVRDVMEKAIIRPLEAANSVWLFYIVFAQTLGAYQTCDCMATTWANQGGYIDFETYDFYTGQAIYLIWSIATGVSLLVMSLGLLYVAFEYCTQSHLSTEHYGRAMDGLKQTRRFKKHTIFVRKIPDAVINLGKLIGHKITRGQSRRERRSLVWTATCKKNPPLIGASMEAGLRMQGTEEQWRNTFMSGGRRSLSGLTGKMKRNRATSLQVPPSIHQRRDLEKG